KPWGYELILTPPDSPVTGKILHLNAGQRFSLQYHEQKEEALVLLSGEVKITLENDQGLMQDMKMEPQRGYYIKAHQKHRCSVFPMIARR
ncbi:MAG: hypothetical protein AAB116_26560, partial [Candidatus Poribacteria bacterium]